MFSSRPSFSYWWRTISHRDNKQYFKYVFEWCHPPHSLAPLSHCDKTSPLQTEHCFSVISHWLWVTHFFQFLHGYIDYFEMTSKGLYLLYLTLTLIICWPAPYVPGKWKYNNNIITKNKIRALNLVPFHGNKLTVLKGRCIAMMITEITRSVRIVFFFFHWSIDILASLWSNHRWLDFYLVL